MTNIWNNRLRVGLDLQQPTGVWTNQFGYDAAKRLTNVTSQAGAFGYTFVGQASRLTQKLSLPNTSYLTNAYDPVARLLSTTLKNSSHTTLNGHTYTYNPANQRTQQVFSTGSTYNYAYDPIGQLKVADSGTASEDRGYLYDAAWNLSKRTNNTTLNSFFVNVKNELTNSTPTGANQFDANGNLTQRKPDGPDRFYTYDDENRLTTVEREEVWRSEFPYDGLGRLRVRKEYDFSGGWNVTSETRYVYDGWRVIQERNGSDVPQVSYTRGTDLSGTLEGAGGIGGLLGRSHGYSAGNWSTHNFYHADGNGNVTYLVNSSQTMAAKYRYDPYGNTISSSGSLAAANVYRFSSKELHVNSGLYYYGFRFYDPNTQSWPNRDPIGERGGLNLYRYADNDPLWRVDPWGLDAGGRVGPGFPSDGYPHPPPPIFGKPSGGNCLGYACGFPGDKQPDGGDGRNNAKNCKDLLKQLKANYDIIDVQPDGNCKGDYHKITVRSDNNGGYHVKRQDADGKWSEASKGGPDQTYPPRKCWKSGGPGESCGDLCAKNQP